MTQRTFWRAGQAYQRLHRAHGSDGQAYAAHGQAENPKSARLWRTQPRNQARHTPPGEIVARFGDQLGELAFDSAPAIMNYRRSVRRRLRCPQLEIAEHPSW